jgi:hypothetical protein
MKRHLLMTLVLLSFVACTKDLLDKTTTPETIASISRKNHAYSTVTEPYSGNYFDSCRKENIILTGRVTYTIKESSDTSSFYLSYGIDLKAIGVGEISGSIFRGGIKQIATVKAANGNVKATINYKLKFVSDGGEQINFTQLAKFVSIDGETKLFFNNISDGCK